MIGPTTTRNRRRPVRLARPLQMRIRDSARGAVGEKEIRVTWNQRDRAREMENGRKGETEGERRGCRMGGRDVLGTRRVSIKWLWPVRYGGFFPCGICIRSGSEFEPDTPRRPHVCTRVHHTLTHAKHGAYTRVRTGPAAMSCQTAVAVTTSGRKLINLQVRYSLNNMIESKATYLLDIRKIA